MAIIAGIDEAGYGPLLGPLVVTGIAFHVPDALAETSLWDVLQASVARRTSGKDRRLPICDSKRLYSTKAGLAALERTALVMLKTTGQQPPTFRRLLEVVAPHALGDLAGYPWYREFDADLPSGCSEGDVATRANAVARDLASAGVRLTSVFCEALMAGHYNRLVAQVRNKARVSLGVVLRIVQRLLPAGSEEHVYVHVDRQGGRTHYREQLMAAFGAYHLRIVEESETRSAYELTRQGTGHRLDFVTSGEDRHLPIALASIYSKYLREWFMRALNAFWARQVAGLKPTAGYYTDARRFLGDIEVAVDKLRIDRNLLVRSR